MGVLHAVSLLVAFCVLITHCALFNDSILKKTDIYQAHISVVYDLLAKSGCSVDYKQLKREDLMQDRLNHLETTKQVYRKLLKKLTECKRNANATTPATHQVISTETTRLSTIGPTTTSRVPAECQQARNLTESWRKPVVGSGKSPRFQQDYECDFHVNSKGWFRFTGAAGRKLLDKCPQQTTCGSTTSYWTNDVMPQMVGKKKEVRAHGAVLMRKKILFLPRNSINCEYHNIPLLVMRCSMAPDDFIYKLTSYKSAPCSRVFCGMM